MTLTSCTSARKSLGEGLFDNLKPLLGHGQDFFPFAKSHGARGARFDANGQHARGNAVNAHVALGQAFGLGVKPGML
jgi:hypothetical protein